MRLKRRPHHHFYLQIQDKRLGIEYNTPVLMNIFANRDITEKILGRNPDEIAKDIDRLLKFKPPKTFLEKIKSIPELLFP